jgi:hypothetical protein
MSEEHFFEEIKTKLNNNIELDENEIYNLIWEYEIASYKGEHHRWDQEMTSIVEFNNKFYAICWRRGLTEMQENSYYEQPIEVHKVERPITITLTEWVNAQNEVVTSSN